MRKRDFCAEVPLFLHVSVRTVINGTARVGYYPQHCREDSMYTAGCTYLGVVGGCSREGRVPREEE